MAAAGVGGLLAIAAMGTCGVLCGRGSRDKEGSVWSNTPFNQAWVSKVNGNNYSESDYLYD